MKLTTQLERVISVIVFTLINGAITVKEAVHSESKQKSMISETTKSANKNVEAKDIPEPSPLCGNLTHSKTPIQRND